MKTVYRGRIHTIKEHPVRQPDGTVVQFEYVYRLGTLVVLPVDDRGRLSLTRERRYPTRQWQWFLPLGRVERGVAPKTAAQRELQEEVGLGARRLRLFYHKERSAKMVWPIHAYLAQDLYPKRRRGDPDEEIIPRPMPLRDAFVIARSARMQDTLLSLLIMTLWYERKKWLGKGAS